MEQLRFMKLLGNTSKERRNMLNPVTISIIVDMNALNTIANSGARQEWVLRVWTDLACSKTLGNFIRSMEIDFRSEFEKITY